ncbi:hypothetical protein ACHHYP_02276 [Achlya hypogyna]|uniref:Uncharacterized protein n=1 Tax=Achlya hypogyna TaxID=1202772 RepID=A0A1V9Z744_ACHHY|nr:hypothetical protein ACHHYP_02276 [Achlya hypogyna]
MEELGTLPAEATVVHKFGMEFHALLATDAAKKKSKLSGLAFHPVRPWAAAVEAKDFGVVWNYETKEVLKRFSLTTGEDAGATTEAAEMPMSPGAINLSKTFSPKLGGNKAKATSTLLFFDRDAIAHATGVAHGIECYEEYLVIFSQQYVVFCDINGKMATRLITPDELQRATPTAIEILPGGYLAIGCSDGKVRVWSPRVSKVCHTIDTGLPRDIAHLVLIPAAKDSGPAVPSTLFHSNGFHCFVATVNVEGKAIVWSLHHLDGDFQQSRASEFDTKQPTGLLEMKLLRQDGVLAAISKDGHVLFWDVSFLLSSRYVPLYQCSWRHQVALAPDKRSSEPERLRSVVFTGGFFAAPTAARPMQATLFIGSSKNNFVMVSSAQTFHLALSDLHSKGKPTTPDQDITLLRADSTKDVRNLHPRVPKAIKIIAIALCPRDTSLLGCATNHGLLMMKLHYFKPNVAMMVPSLPAVVLSTNTHLRTLPLLEKSKKELYALKYGAKDSVPLLRKHPAHDVVAIVSATGTNFEIASIVREASTAVQYQMVPLVVRAAASSITQVTYGPGQAVAWHAHKLRYAVLSVRHGNDAFTTDTHDTPQRRMTRSASAVLATESPRRKLGFFSKADEAPMASGPQLSYFYKTDVKALDGVTAVALFDIVNGVANVVVDGLSLRNPIVHLFSGPLLGVVYCVLPQEKPPTPLSPKTKAVDATAASMVAGGDDLAMVKFQLELYAWDHPVIPAKDGSPSLPAHLSKVGVTLPGPLLLEWDASGTYGVLVYPQKIAVLRLRDGALESLHRIGLARPVVSVLWVHQTLFAATEDDITCYFFCGSRHFSFLLASATAFNESANPLAVHPTELPVAQQHPGGVLALLGVVRERLYMTGAHHIYSIDLQNEVLQFCMYVAQGSPEKALALVPHISVDLTDYLATFLDAFGFGLLALPLPTVSLSLKASLCIKHSAVETLLELLPQLVALPDDSPDILGTSLLQRCVASLVRGGRAAACTAQSDALLQRRRLHDVMYVAVVTSDKQLLARALRAKEEWSLAALHTKGDATDLLEHWGHALAVSASKHAVTLRPPELSNLWQ